MIGIFANICSFRAICGMVAIVYVYGWSLAWIIGNKNFQNNDSFCMVRLNRPVAFLLFLRFFKRKVSLWAVLMQIINLLILLSSIIAHLILQEDFDGSLLPKIFGWMHAINIYGITVLLIGTEGLQYIHKKRTKKSSKDNQPL